MTDDRGIAPVAGAPPPLIETFAKSFQDDPALVYLLPDPAVRRRLLPRFFTIMAGQSRRHGSILATESFNSGALLYPPGPISDGRLWDSLQLLAIFKTALPRGLKVAEAMHQQHPHPQPHIYLRYLAVSPDAQGQGLGGAMVRKITREAAHSKMGVLLETANETNVPIYLRLGFKVTSEWSVPDDGPRFWTMIHPAPV